MPYLSSSLAYISPLAQTADTDILLLGFLGKGQGRYTLLCAFRSMLWDSHIARAPLQHEAVRLWRHPTGCKPLLLPGTALLCPWFLHQGCSTQGSLLLFLSWYTAHLSHLIISPEPPSALLSEKRFFLQQWVQLAGVCKAEGSLNQGRSHGKAAREPGVSATRDLHTNLATEENPA